MASLMEIVYKIFFYKCLKTSTQICVYCICKEDNNVLYLKLLV